MAKGNKIDALAIVKATGTATVNGPQECSFVDFIVHDGNIQTEYRWQSEKAGWVSYCEGQIVELRAFARENGRLYRVSVTSPRVDSKGLIYGHNA